MAIYGRPYPQSYQYNHILAVLTIYLSSVNMPPKRSRKRSCGGGPPPSTAIDMAEAPMPIDPDPAFGFLAKIPLPVQFPHRVLAPVIPVLPHHLYSLSQLPLLPLLHQLRPLHHAPHTSQLHFSLLQLVENPPSPSWKRFLLLSPFILPRTIGLWSLRLWTQYVYCDECILHILIFHTAIHRLCPLICPCSKLSTKLSESRSQICHQMYYLICSPFHYLQILPTAIRTSEYQRSGQCCQPA